jgi:hypothetical protein
MNRKLLVGLIRWVAGAVCLVASSVLHATLLYSVSLDTSPLIGHSAAPFYLDFQLNDGSGGITGNGNNTATLSGFAFDGGSAANNPVTFGGASGSLTSDVVITDSDFSNEFYEGFTPGSTLRFLLELTANAESPAPDQFSFAILYSMDSPLPEIPTESVSDVFVEIDIDSKSPTVRTYAGDGIAIAAPVVTRVSVPEPASVALLAIGLIGLLLTRRAVG